MAGQACVTEKGLEEEVGKGARVVQAEQEDREQTLPPPREPCERALPAAPRELWEGTLRLKSLWIGSSRSPYILCILYYSQLLPIHMGTQGSHTKT